MNRPQRRLPRPDVIRQPRQRELLPIVTEPVQPRRPRRVFTSPFILFFGFVLLTLAGGLLLALPVASQQGEFTTLEQSFFTAVSAVTVTGLTVVNTGDYWSYFGQAVIFALMLIGGLSFMALATSILTLIGQRSSLSERLVMRDTIGVDRLEGLRRVTRNIVILVFSIYVVGAIAIFWRIHGMAGMGLAESIWQSAFLSVSAFNNAGFSILPEIPEGTGLGWLAGADFLLLFMLVLIVLGSIGWTVLVDLYRNRRLSRLSLDTKLVLVTTVFLWAFGALVFILAESTNPDTHATLSVLERLKDSIFHSISGRTAGFTIIDFGEATDFTKLTYPFLMFIGGASGSVAGGIKVNTFAVAMAAVIATVRGRPQAEAFGRSIGQAQVLRALTVGVLGLAYIGVIVPTLTLTEDGIPFLNLLFDTVSAFGTTGSSTGIVPQLSLAGKCLFMVTMFVGRLGPLTLALALAPRESTVYRFVEERVRIG